MELTPLEIKVTELRNSGKKYREIGEILGINREYVRLVYNKAKHRAQYINGELAQNEIERFLGTQASNRYCYAIMSGCWIFKIKTIADFSNIKEETFLKFRKIGKVGLKECLRLRDIARERVKEAEAAEHE